MKPVEDYNSVEEFVDEHREIRERVLRHSHSTYARSCAWVLINAGSDVPDIDQLQQELQAVKEVVWARTSPIERGGLALRTRLGRITADRK